MRRLLPLMLLAACAWASDPPDEHYRTPPAALAAIVDAPASPAVSTSPAGRTLVLGAQAGLLTIADLARPELKLAGLRFDPGNRGSGRATYMKSLTLVDAATRASRPVAGLPPDPHLRHLAWSPDERHVAFTHATTAAVELWVLEVASARARPLGVRLNTVRTGALHWMPDSRALLVLAVPAGQGPPPPPDDVPAGPAIEESVAGKKAPARTHQDLLKTAHDEALFEHYVASDVVLAPLDAPARKLFGPLALVACEPSPDGKYLLVETTHRPFSRIVPASLFPLRSEVRTPDGAVVATVADLPAAEDLSPDKDAVRPGRRDIAWRADAPAVLAGAEALDGGEPKREVPAHDSVWTLAPPFTGAPVRLATLEHRYTGVEWASDRLALVGERWWKTRRTRTWRVAPGKPDAKPERLFDRSWEDRYADPGDPVHRVLPSGHAVMLTSADGAAIYLAGEGASPEGDRPFLDRFDLATRKATRLWRSEPPHHERVLKVLDDAAAAFLTVREAVAEPRNVFRRAGGKLEALTGIPHPAPQLIAVKKELIRYQRADGVDLTGILYLPPGYTPRKDPPLPVLMWAYPASFKSAALAGQVQDSPHRFVGPSPSQPVMYALAGYAVLDDPTFPIVGEGKAEPNDTYVKQLVMGGEAAVAELVRRGVGDPDRMAIGGHSYGAFTAANLLAHSDLFRAGVARSGAYNRTLTPFGFQSEERTFWEAADTYVAMSPFTVADRIDEPLLLIHGMEDANSGTFPIQSERMFHALKGLGKTARIVMLPKESHGYAARESLLHVAAETEAWLDRHVKRAGPRKKKP